MRKGAMVWWMACLVLGAAAPATGGEARSTTKIALLDLRDKGVGEQVASLLTTAVARQLGSYGLFEVFSREEIRNLLTFEQNNMLLGCVDESCLTDFGKLLGADALVAGEVGMVGSKYVINLRRFDTRQVKVVQRVERQMEGNRSQLIEEAKRAAHLVVEDVLKAESGSLLFTVSEEGADVAIDGVTVGTSPLASVSVPAGPHDVRVTRQGFVAWARTLQVQPRGVQMVEVILIPSAEFVQAYSERSGRMRRWAWITAAAFVALEGAALGMRGYTLFEVDPKVDDYNNQQYDACGGTQTACYEAYRDDVRLAEKLDYTALGVGIGGLIAGAVSLYLFLEGDDPGRYGKFEGLTAPVPSSASFAPLPGGGALTLGWGF